MSEPLSIKDMPYITTEQVARYRSASLAIEQQRDELLEALKDATPQPSLSTEADKVRELVEASESVCKSLEHPTETVNAMQMWKLRDALEAMKGE